MSKSALDINDMKELIRMKNETPDEYKKFLSDLCEVVKDLNKVILQANQ